MAGFPRYTLRGTRQLHRIHQHQNWPWWFSSLGDGRFDPVGTGRGACYFADRGLGAWVETFRKQMKWADQDIRARHLQMVALGRDLRLANLISRRALRFGVTATIGADEEYDESQDFARKALREGFDGLRYLVRHDPSQRLVGIALFGPEGEAGHGDPDWPLGVDGAIPPDILAEAQRAFGYEIVPTP